MNAKVLEDVKLAAKRLINSNGRSVDTKFPSLEETVNGILSATTPARKAHATRKLTSYAVNHAKKINSTPTRVIAGVCAVVTKRMTKPTKQETVADLSRRVITLQKKLELLQAAAFGKDRPSRSGPVRL